MIAESVDEDHASFGSAFRLPCGSASALSTGRGSDPHLPSLCVQLLAVFDRVPTFLCRHDGLYTRQTGFLKQGGLPMRSALQRLCSSQALAHVRIEVRQGAAAGLSRGNQSTPKTARKHGFQHG